MTRKHLIDPREYIRTGTAMKIMGVTQAYINRMIVNGQFPGITIDGQHFVRRADAEAFTTQPGVRRGKLASTRS